MKKVWLFMLFILNNFCSSSLNCSHGRCKNCESCLCASQGSLDCTHQLSTRLNDSSCVMNFIRGAKRNEELVLQPWRRLYPAEERPFLLHVYRQRFYTSYYRTGFNISFHDFKVTDLQYRFRFRNMADEKEDLGREFVLRNLPLSAGSNSVFWDCPFFNNYVGKEHVLTVLDSRDSGGEYSFIVPDPKRINPSETTISDWQLLILLDLGVYNRRQEAAITVQLAPFSNLTYRVELLTCQERDSCQNGTLVSSEEFHITNLEDQGHRHRNVAFDFQGPAIYMLSAQLLHETCPEGGCFRSQTTLLEIEVDHQSRYILLGSLLFGLAFTLGLLYIHRARQHKKMISKLSVHPVSLLLVYLPETVNHYRFVETLANLLRDTCFVKTFLVDRDAGRMNPHEWTVRRMEEADRIVFLIPSSADRSLRSIMPVQNQWRSSLSHFSDSYLIRHGSTKVASILIHSESIWIPAEIANLRRFHLLQELSSFVGWIHNTGSKLDRWLLWWPLVHSKKSKMMLRQLKSSLKKIIETKKVSPTSGGRSQACDKNISILTPSSPLCSSNQHSLDAREDAEDIYTEDSTDEFDPNIKSVESLLLQSDQQCSGESDDEAYSYCDETSSLADDLFV